MKQKLTAFDFPPPIPALQMDLSHILANFKPSHFNSEDIPPLPVISKSGRLKQFVNRTKRVTSMPMMKFKSLPLPPSLASPVRSQSNSVDDFFSPLLPPLLASPVRSQSNSVDDFLSSVLNPKRSVTSPITLTDMVKANNSAKEGNGGHSSKGSVASDTNITFIDSLFSNDDGSANGGSYKASSCDDLVSSSLLEVLRLYNESEASSVNSLLLEPENMTELPDSGSIYSSNVSQIISNYVNEKNNEYKKWDLRSVNDSLFSRESEHATPLNETPLNQTPLNGTTIKESALNETLLRETAIKSALNETALNEPPLNESPIKESLNESLNMSKVSLNKDLPPPPLIMKKTRKTNRNMDTLDPYKVRNPLPKTPGQIRPFSMCSIPSQQSGILSTVSTGRLSLADAKLEIKQRVRQRPFSYCLDSSEDYSYSRYAISAIKKDTYRARTVSTPQPQPQPETQQQTHTPPQTPTQPETQQLQTQMQMQAQMQMQPSQTSLELTNTFGSNNSQIKLIAQYLMNTQHEFSTSP